MLRMQRRDEYVRDVVLKFKQAAQQAVQAELRKALEDAQHEVEGVEITAPNPLLVDAFGDYKQDLFAQVALELQRAAEFVGIEPQRS